MRFRFLKTSFGSTFILTLRLDAFQKLPLTTECTVIVKSLFINLLMCQVSMCNAKCQMSMCKASMCNVSNVKCAKCECTGCHVCVCVSACVQCLRCKCASVKCPCTSVKCQCVTFQCAMCKLSSGKYQCVKHQCATCQVSMCPVRVCIAPSVDVPPMLSSPYVKCQVSGGNMQRVKCASSIGVHCVKCQKLVKCKCARVKHR